MSDLLSKYGYRPRQPQEEEDELQPTPTGVVESPLSKYGYQGTAQQASATPTGRTVLGTAKAVGMGAARGLASALEPVALPQDIAFAIAAGNADPDDDTTITDRLKRIEWGKYAPFGEAPARPADGAEILGLMGLEDEKVKRFGGLALDLTADPLIAGAVIRGVGKLGKVEGLAKFGDDLDELSSVGGIARRAYKNPAVKAWADARAEEALKVMRNPENRFLGLNAGTAADLFLMGRTGRRLKYGREVGDAISDARALSDQAGETVAQRGIDLIAEAERGLLGKEARPFLQRAVSIMGGGRKAEGELKGLPQILHDSILKETYDTANRRGLLLTDTAESAIPEVRTLSPFSRFADPEAKATAATDFQASVQRVRDLAEKNKFSPDLAERRYKDFSQKVTEVDAMLGFHLSGYDFVQKRVMRNVVEAGGTRDDAVRVWEGMVRSGMQGRLDGFLDSASSFKPTRSAAARDLPAGTTGPRATVDTPKLSYRDVLFSDQSADTFGSLELGAFFKGLQDGHMRRAYGIFQDARGAERYVKGVEQGRVILNNIIDDDAIDTALAGMDAGAFRAVGTFNVRAGDGPSASVASLVKDYRRALEGNGRGTVLTKSGLMQHLTENGVSPERANEALLELVRVANPSLEPLVKNLRDVAGRYAEAYKGGGAGGGFGRAFTKQREELDTAFLEQLGEYANPILSLAETAQGVRTRLPRQQFMAETFDLARQKGYIRGSQYVDENGAHYVKVHGDENAWGAFSGQYVHPYLKAEIEKTMKPTLATKVPLVNALGRVRSLITGGYLASPNVIVANIAGGVYTSAMAGIGPGRMLKAMTQTLPDMLRGTSADAERLREYIALDNGSLVTQGYEKALNLRKLSEAGIEGGGLSTLFDRVTGFIGDQLQAPLGQKWAGLEGFQFAENWLKVSAFKAERAYFTSNPDVLRKYAGDVTDVQGAAEKLAAQKARVAVFDYGDLPEAVTRLRDTGLLMFPGFSVMLAARNLDAVINRPGAIAMPDRLSEAVWSATMDDEEKLAVYASMPEWLRDDQGVPVRFMRDEAGDKRVSVIPFNQLVPVSTSMGKAYTESLLTGGIYSPFYELASAFMTGTGEAPFSQRYGNQVFSPDARGLDRAAQAGQFMLKSLAPGFARKVVDTAKVVREQAIPVGGPLANSLYTYSEIATRKASRRVADQVIADVLRSPQITTMSGPLASVQKEMNRIKVERSREVSSLKKRYQRAVATGQTSKARKLAAEIATREAEFAELMRGTAEAYQGAR